jgi:hypothetical protein
MYLIRDIMYCKPGKVRPMVDKFVAMSKLGEKVGMPRMRIMTDLCAEQYWTVVSEMEVPSLQAFDDMMSKAQGSAEDMKKIDEIMKGYHDLVERGRREIYKLEEYPLDAVVDTCPSAAHRSYSAHWGATCPRQGRLLPPILVRGNTIGPSSGLSFSGLQAPTGEVYVQASHAAVHPRQSQARSEALARRPA